MLWKGAVCLTYSSYTGTMVQYVSHTVAIQVHACYGRVQYVSHTVAIQVHACNGAVCLTYSSYTGTMVQYVSHTVAIQVHACSAHCRECLINSLNAMG